MRALKRVGNSGEVIRFLTFAGNVFHPVATFPGLRLIIEVSNWIDSIVRNVQLHAWNSASVYSCRAGGGSGTGCARRRALRCRAIFIDDEVERKNEERRRKFVVCRSLYGLASLDEMLPPPLSRPFHPLSSSSSYFNGAIAPRPASCVASMQRTARALRAYLWTVVSYSLTRFADRSTRRTAARK